MEIQVKLLSQKHFLVLHRDAASSSTEEHMVVLYGSSGQIQVSDIQNWWVQTAGDELCGVILFVVGCVNILKPVSIYWVDQENTVCAGRDSPSPSEDGYQLNFIL